MVELRLVRPSGRLRLSGQKYSVLLRNVGAARLARAHALGVVALGVIRAAPLEPPSPTLRILKGKTEFALGRHDDAQRTLELALAFDEVKVQAATLLARQAIDRGDVGRADQMVERAVKLGTRDRIVREYGARMMMDRGRHDECIVLAKELLADAAENRLDLLGILAESYIATSQASLAEELLVELVVASPNEPSAHDAYGRALLALNRPKEAADRFAEAIQLDSDAPRKWFHLGVARANNRECDASIEALDRSIDLDGQHGPSYFARAVCLARLHDYDAAQISLQRALALDEHLMDAAGEAEVFEVILAADKSRRAPIP